MLQTIFYSFISFSNDFSKTWKRKTFCRNFIHPRKMWRMFTWEKGRNLMKMTQFTWLRTNNPTWQSLKLWVITKKWLKMCWRQFKIDTWKMDHEMRLTCPHNWISTVLIKPSRYNFKILIVKYKKLTKTNFNLTV